MSKEMKELDAEAKAAGVTIVNEVGLDPGIDHLLAMECFDQVKSNGGKITSFVSYCGGLPAPEVADNPLKVCLRLFILFKPISCCDKFFAVQIQLEPSWCHHEHAVRCALVGARVRSRGRCWRKLNGHG